ncbi:Swi3-domain-containing protein [Lophiostoma macrostomum CBS 122681]|uniref:Chromosome segregation in meiosis protein n=1 Tax=Lophiostoma macrostomum CBS 122681 TaxID=1314788 RepID=A0A6A6SZV7_9PLEO|nr:Swi3-domain-containing protein [Lophiostoma macrostomum CBS 122681]
MASVTHARPAVPADDELDDILNGIVDGENVFDASQIRPQTQPQAQQKKSSDTNLGIDEEIKIVKQRRPIPKLDDNRLLSDAGIPRLRKISKDRLRFKGKGHEYGDIARMLNMYQLWLDDLYPRAKFADGLAMIEKLGHSKRIQYMRKEWINESKPRHTAGDSDEEEEVDAQASTTVAQPDLMEGVQSEQRTQDADTAEREQESNQLGLEPTPTPSGAAEPDDDELDALLAEEAETNRLAQATTMPSQRPAVERDAFADEMEAMADMDDFW